MQSYAFDFETTVFNGTDEKTNVWLAYFEDVDSGKNHLFTSIDEVMKWLTSQTEINLYAHNLGGFDGLAIDDWLGKNNYVVRNRFSEDSKNLNKFYIAQNNQTRLFTIYTRQADGKLGAVTLIDTTSYLNGSIEEFGKLFDMTKGATPLIPYGIDHAPTKADIDYIKRNVAILKKAIKEFKVCEIYENQLHSISSYAYYTALSGKGELTLDRLPVYDPPQQTKYRGFRKRPSGVKALDKTALSVVERSMVIAPKDRNKEPYLWTTKPRTLGRIDEIDYFINREQKELGATDDENTRELIQSQIDKLQSYKLAELSKGKDKVLSNLFRKSYRAVGWYLNDNYRDKDIARVGVVLDVNSKFPSVYSRYRFPNMNRHLGLFSSVAEMDSKLEGDYLYLVIFDRLKATVKEGKAPIIKARNDDYKNYNLFDKRTPKSFDYVDFVMTQPDYEYLVEHYDIELAENPSFNAFEPWEEMEVILQNHADFWYNRKREASLSKDKITYHQAKSMLNNVVGYLGRNPENYKGGKATPQPTVGVSAFINAYSRVELAIGVNALGLENIYYGNADSIHLAVPSELVAKTEEQTKQNVSDWLENIGFFIDDYELGAWKIETVFKRAKYLAFGTYGVEDWSGNWKTKTSGYSHQVPQDQFYSGNVVKQLRPYRVDGGILLKETDFILAGGLTYGDN